MSSMIILNLIENSDMVLPDEYEGADLSITESDDL